MKILLDECIDRKLAREFIGYDVKTFPQMGWAGIKNGQLLALAESEFGGFAGGEYPNSSTGIDQSLQAITIIIIELIKFLPKSNPIRLNRITKF